MGARDDVVRTAVLERAAHLVLAEVVRSSAVDLVKYLDAALLQRLLASWKLLRGGQARDARVEMEPVRLRTAVFMRTQVLIFWNGTSSETVPHSTS